MAWATRMQPMLRHEGQATAKDNGARLHRIDIETVNDSTRTVVYS
jgi:hypothetical protein